MTRRSPLTSGLELARLSAEAATMMAEANMVVLMRMWGIAGFWNVTPRESTRMVAEKAAAAQASALAAARAAGRGASPVAVASAALKPVRARTRSNVARLAKRGPGPRQG